MWKTDFSNLTALLRIQDLIFSSMPAAYYAMTPSDAGRPLSVLPMNLKEAQNDHLKFRITPRLYPNDEFVDEQGALGLVEFFQAWEFGFSDESVLVAIIDSGVYINTVDCPGKPCPAHEDLEPNLWLNPTINQYGIDLTENEKTELNGADDVHPDSHGTKVAGVLGAVINNARGIAGSVNPELLPIKIADQDYNATLVESAISNAINKGADIISMSWGFTEQQYQDAIDLIPGIEAAIKDAYYNNDILLFAAVANDATAPVDFPGNMSEVIAVGVADMTGESSGDHAVGPELELLAPGCDIYTTRRLEENPYGYLYTLVSGCHTSLATPYAAGIAALVRMQAPGLTNIEVRYLLQNSTIDLGPTGRDDATGFGLLNAWLAVTNALGGDLGIVGDAGNTLSEARTITSSACSTGCDAFLNEGNDSEDWYTFNIDDPNNNYNWIVDIDVVPEADDDIRLELRDAAGNLVTESDKGGDGIAEDILYEVRPSNYGDYYLLVQMKPPAGTDYGYGAGRYTITLTTYVVGLKGYVTNLASGAAISGAKVRVSNAERTYTTSTDSSGYYEVTASVSLVAGWTTKDFQLPKKPTGTLYGYVKDEFNHPINNANVRENLCYRKTTTDSNGYYSLTVVAEEQISVSAYKTGYKSQTKYVTVPAGGSKRLDFSLECATICIKEGGPELMGGDAGKLLSEGRDDGIIEAGTAPLRRRGASSGNRPIGEGG